jgi:hypothetical protein
MSSLIHIKIIIFTLLYFHEEIINKMCTGLRKNTHCKTVIISMILLMTYANNTRQCNQHGTQIGESNIYALFKISYMVWLSDKLQCYQCNTIGIFTSHLCSFN